MGSSTIVALPSDWATAVEEREWLLALMVTEVYGWWEEVKESRLVVLCG